MPDPNSPVTPLPSRVTVAVVGAGYAGLSAALRLQEAGTDVLVLEAAERVGGRTLSERLADGTVIDHGGQWVGPTQRHLLDLATRFGVETFPTFNEGDHIEIWHDGSQRRYRIAGPTGGPGMAHYLEAVERIDALAATVNLDNPEETPEARRWDSETCQSYFERTVHDPDSRARLALAVQGVWTVEPRDISVLHLLFYVASAGGFEQLMETEGCAQDSRFSAGAQELALRIADHLGARVHLDTRVTSIEHDAEHVRLCTSRGDVVADRVIMSVPPAAALRIPISPPLTVARNRWIEKSPMGDVAKIHVGYPTPFWRTRGLSGEATTYGDRPVGVVFDNSPADARRGVLVCFVYADRLHDWVTMSDDARKHSVLAVLVELFGEDAASPNFYTEKIWSLDPFVHGGYAANPTPGTWVEHTAGWRQPAGLLHWAGSETASVWNGYIDGAISSGLRAADEVVRCLTN